MFLNGIFVIFMLNYKLSTSLNLLNCIKMAIVDTALNIEANLPLIKTPEINARFVADAETLKNSVK